MANVLNEEKKQQVLALGRLGWPLRQIQKATRIRRETASQYLKVGDGERQNRPPPLARENRTSRWSPTPTATTEPTPKTLPLREKATSKPANEVITDSAVITDLNPFQRDEVGALFPERERGQAASPQRSPSASACEAYSEAIESGLSRDRNPMELVTVRGATKRTRKPRSLTVEEFQKFIRHLEEPFRTLALVCVCFGLRVSECLALKWSDVDWLDGKLRVERGIVRQQVGKVKTI
jgi:integrase